jgi:hypothetical protein
VFGELGKFASLVIVKPATDGFGPMVRTASRTNASQAAMSPALPAGGW